MPIQRQLKKTDKFILLLAALLVLFTLPGCSGLLGLGQEPVTLRFVYLDQGTDYAPFAEAFKQEHPNITVELDPVSTSGGNPMSALKSKAAGADAVRIPSMSMDEDMLPTLLPLDSYVTTDPNFPQNDFFAGALDGLRVDGKQIGVPAGLNPYVVFYNPLKFQIRGVKPPSAGWTLEDFMTSAMAINNTDESLVGTPDYAYGFCSTPQFPDALIFTYIFDGGVFDSVYAPTAPTLNIPANVEALSWYISLRNEFGLMPPSDQPRDVGMLIVRSSCGFWMDWLDRSSFGNFMTNQEVAALPLPNYQTPVSISTLDFYSILATSTHPDETWKWLRFLLDQPTASGRLIPPRQSHITSEDYGVHTPSDILGVARNMPSQGIVLGLETIRDSRLGAVLELYARATLKALHSDISVQAALDEVQDQAVQSFGR